MKQKPLEIIESVDMLRILEYGYTVKMVYSHYDTYSEDTSRDHDLVEEKMTKVRITKEYMNLSRSNMMGLKRGSKE